MRHKTKHRTSPPSLQWRHNGRDGVSNHRCFDCLPKAQIKENIKAPRHWPLLGEYTGDQWIPRTKCQYHGNCFHLMTSSWCPKDVLIPTVTSKLCDHFGFYLLVIQSRHNLLPVNIGSIWLCTIKTELRKMMVWSKVHKVWSTKVCNTLLRLVFWNLPLPLNR